MRPLATLAVLCAAITSISVALPATAQQSVQQLPTFRSGDAVDFYSFGKWIPCSVSSSVKAGGYNVHCGSIDLLANADPRELRPHVVPPPGVMLAFGIESAPAPAVNLSIGARYGTRDPRDCDRHAAQFSADEAKDVFICDAEHEFGGSLYLVSNVSLEVGSPRPFNPATDSRQNAIDHASPVYEIHATYNNFQCSPIPASHYDYPNVRNCSEYHTTQAAGACFKSTSGDWHCEVSDPTAATVVAAQKVSPPTLVD